MCNTLVMGGPLALCHSRRIISGGGNADRGVV